MKGPEESVNNEAVIGCEPWMNSLERPSTGQAGSFVAARTTLTPSWSDGVLETAIIAAQSRLGTQWR